MSTLSQPPLPVKTRQEFEEAPCQESPSEVEKPHPNPVVQHPTSPSKLSMHSKAFVPKDAPLSLSTAPAVSLAINGSLPNPLPMAQHPVSPSKLGMNSKVFIPRDGSLPLSTAPAVSLAANGSLATKTTSSKALNSAAQPYEPEEKRQEPSLPDTAGTAEADPIPAAKTSKATKVACPNLAVPWKSRTLEKKKMEEQPKPHPQKALRTFPEQSTVLQKPTFPPGLEGAGRRAKKPPGFDKPLHGAPTAKASTSTSTATERQGGTETPLVEVLADQLEFLWPTLGESKPVTAAPEWVAKKVQPQVEAVKEEESLRARRTPVPAAPTQPQWVIRDEGEQEGGAAVKAYPPGMPLPSAGDDHITVRYNVFVPHLDE